MSLGRDNLKAWAHWVKLNPLDENQLAHAEATEELLEENARLRAALEKIRDEGPWDKEKKCDIARDTLASVRDTKP